MLFRHHGHLPNEFGKFRVFDSDQTPDRNAIYVGPVSARSSYQRRKSLKRCKAGMRGATDWENDELLRWVRSVVGFCT